MPRAESAAGAGETKSTRRRPRTIAPRLTEDGVLTAGLKKELLALTNQQIVAQCPSTGAGVPQPTTGAAAQPGAGATGTVPTVDPRKLQEFAGAIRGQSIVSSGATIAVSAASADTASNIVAVIVGVSGGTLTDSQIKEALLAKGDGASRGVSAANIRLTRS